MDRQVSVLVADDIRTEISGKFVIIGAYTQDIRIASDPFYAWQLWFLFEIESDIDDPFLYLVLEVTLPEQPTVSLHVPETTLRAWSQAAPGRSRRKLTQPLVVHPAVVRPGRIIARMVHERGGTEAVAPWIALASPS